MAALVSAMDLAGGQHLAVAGDRTSDRISYERSTNARPFNRVARQYPSHSEKKKYVARFGCRMASALLLLELGAHGKLSSGWDSEWYEGEFLSRLGDRLFLEPGFDVNADGLFDWSLELYQYESVDLDALLSMSKRRYREILLSVLRGLFEEEGIGGAITDAVRRRFRLPRF